MVVHDVGIKLSWEVKWASPLSILLNQCTSSIQLCFFEKTGPVTTSSCDIILCAVLKVGTWITAGSFPGKRERESGLLAGKARVKNCILLYMSMHYYVTYMANNIYCGFYTNYLSIPQIGRRMYSYQVSHWTWCMPYKWKQWSWWLESLEKWSSCSLSLTL